MNKSLSSPDPSAAPDMPDYDELLEPVGYDFGLKRRSFMQILGAGLLMRDQCRAGASATQRWPGATPLRGRSTPIHLGKEWLGPWFPDSEAASWARRLDARPRTSSRRCTWPKPSFR